MSALLQVDANGLYCTAGDFYIDPWRPVNRAIVTHAHSDHAHWGCAAYLCSTASQAVLRSRVGQDSNIEPRAYGEGFDINGVRVSLHPAGHILGSAQIRVESRGEVWVVSGDYKLERDPTCTPFEPVKCHTFVTESTFGLPIYRWGPPCETAAEMNAWWRGNQESGKASVLFAYSLGKAQRVLAAVDPNIGPIFGHGAVEKLNRIYRDTGITLPDTLYAGSAPAGADWSRALVIAPPSAHGSTWIRRFGPVSTAFASGWMRIRGTRRRRSIDRGFVVSDHADWPGLITAIRATEAERVLVTHGYRAPLVRWLCEQGRDAKALETRYDGERDEGTEPEAAEADNAPEPVPA